ncbi:ATP-binding cassette, sub-B (MDR TAP), member 4, partial [Quaeritorhiza haematococci]
MSIYPISFFFICSFDTTIRKNILCGLHEDLRNYSRADLDAMVRSVCDRLGLWSFISSLPKGMYTRVGEAGHLLSGGQRQRITIARAIISNPPILLLDEATSALDTASERMVQEAIAAASEKRTVIMIAHRLSTVRGADLIAVMRNGTVVEVGNHGKLMSMKGVYSKLVKAQEIKRQIHGVPAAVKKVGREEESAMVPSSFLDLRRVASEETIVDLSGEMDDMDKEEDKTAAVIDMPPFSSRDTSEKDTSMKKPTSSVKKAKSEKKQRMNWFKLMKLAGPSWPWLLLGTIASLANGVIMPFYSVVFSEVLGTFAKQGDEFRSSANFWVLILMLLALGSFVVNFAQSASLGLLSERILRRLRRECFTAIVNYDVDAFDQTSGATGTLTTRLSEDSTQVSAFFGGYYGLLMQTIASVIAGLVISFRNGWQMTLIVLASFPVIGIFTVLHMFTRVHFGKRVKDAQDTAAAIADQGFSNVRVIATLTIEEMFEDMFRVGSIFP